MEAELKYKGQLDKYLQEWLSPRGIQPDHGLFSDEEKQQSIRIEDSAPEGAIISNQAPEGVTYTMVIVTWSYKVEGYKDNIDAPLCGRLYKEEDDSLVTWSGTDPYVNLNCFIWSKEENDWIVLGDEYNEELKNWRRPIQNGQLCMQNLKNKRKTDMI